MPRNDSNFLIWFASDESPFDSGLPRPFVREPEVISPVVWLVPGEEVSFYINSMDNIALSGNLQLIDEKLTTHELDKDLVTFDFPNGQHVYGSFTVPDLPEGLVRLKLGDYQTQYLWLSTAANAADVTAVVKFRNGDRLVNYRYRYLPDDFMQTFRVRLAAKSIEGESNKATYRSSTTGKTRPLYSEPRSIITFITAEYDWIGHKAMANMIEHDTILINDVPYAYSQPYKANTIESDALTQGEFSLSDERFSTLIRA